MILHNANEKDPGQSEAAKAVVSELRKAEQRAEKEGWITDDMVWSDTDD